MCFNISCHYSVVKAQREAAAEAWGMQGLMIVLINQNYRRCQPCFELLEIKLYGCTMNIFGNYLNSHEMISLENQNIFSLISALLMRHIVLCLGCSERIGCFLFYTSRGLSLCQNKKEKRILGLYMERTLLWLLWYQNLHNFF